VQIIHVILGQILELRPLRACPRRVDDLVVSSIPECPDDLGTARFHVQSEIRLSIFASITVNVEHELNAYVAPNRLPSRGPKASIVHDAENT
jgi:hypothetical protein